MEIDKFKHSVDVRVRSYHVDSQNIVHNAWYLFFFEEGRMEYFRDVSMILDEKTLRDTARFQIVRNTCDYRSPALFDEILQIFTRVAAVRNTSIILEQIIIEKKSGRLVAEGGGVAVFLNARTGRPERLPDEFRDRIASYEGGSVEFTEMNQ